jgi:hypothetical protein
MPRKYRPPTKRRKAKKANIPYEFAQQLDEPSHGEAAVGVAEEDVQALRQAEPIVAAGRLDRAETAEREMRRSGEKHVSRDYSYVRGEVLRIGAIVGFLLVSLFITSLFRN